MGKIGVYKGKTYFRKEGLCSRCKKRNRYKHPESGNVWACCKKCQRVRNNEYKHNIAKEKGIKIQEYFHWSISGLGIVYKSYKRSCARQRGFSWEISKAQFDRLSQADCYYCGSPPKKMAATTYNGLDRLDNDLGYTMDNVVSCCYNCNSAKGKLSKKEFIEHIRKIFHHTTKI